MTNEKNLKIKESFLKTREKRQTQDCRVFSIKIQNNKLNQIQQEQLKMLFVEAKWLKNNILNHFEQNHNFDYPSNRIYIIKKNLDGSFEQKNLVYLGSQMKQSVYTDIISNLKTLHSLKARNKQKAGKLKYCSEYKSINLKQFGNTYKIINNSHLKIQNIKGGLSVKGLKQIDFNKFELTNAKLINTPRGYYLNITCYCNKEITKPTNSEEIGIDMGIKTNLTLSNGLTINASIQESDRLKRLQRRLNLKQKGSKNRKKLVNKIKIEYQKMNNKKKDLTNKIIHQLDQYSLIVIQDEMLASWHSGFFGKQIQHSVLGKIKEKIKQKAAKDSRYIIISKKYKTTQICSNCGAIHKMKLTDRTYTCECGLSVDRDLNSAKNILNIGQELIEFKPVEKPLVSKNQEDTRSLA